MYSASRYFIVITTTCILSLLVLYSMIMNHIHLYRYILQDYSLDTNVGQHNNLISFIIDTSECKIPNIDPHEDSISRLVQPGIKIICRGLALTYQKKNRIYLNWTAVAKSKLKNTLVSCAYKPIYRPRNGSSHNYFKYLNQSKNFNTSLEVKEEFIRVQCFDRKKQVIYTYFHAFIVERKDVKSRLKAISKRNNFENEPKEKTNVLMIGTDSVSRLNSIRHLSKVRLYLLRELGSFELLGYNKVGLNTFPNLVPMLTGKHAEELLEHQKLTQKMAFDKYNFIWKNFSNHGYRTFYAEDAPYITAFDYVKAGFKEFPTDYFNRHFSLAMDAESKLWDSEMNCISDKLENEIILDYITQFISRFRKDPFFIFAFFSKITHSSLRQAATMDNVFLKFFKYLNEHSYLNNTIVLFFSDHGIRFGSLRRTYIGSLEDRLPMMHVILPKRMMALYPDIARNVAFNTMRLSTPFDIYETLKDILNWTDLYNNVPSFSRGVSLFNRIPENRNCESAGIPIEFCACAQYEEVPRHSSTAEIISKKVVQSVNILLKDYFSVCHKLKLDKTFSVIKIINTGRQSYDSKQDKVEYYHAKIETIPGDAIFEATCQHNLGTKKFTVVGEISRISLYGNQSHCVNDVFMKNFCYCKDIADD